MKKSTAKSDPDPSDIADFLYIVQGVVTASTIKTGRNLIQTAAILSRASLVARSSSFENGVLSAAIEFCDENLPDFAGPLDEEEKKARERKNATTLAKFGSEEEEFIDGVWQEVKADWESLPSNSEAELNILAALRERPNQTVTELVGQGFGGLSSVKQHVAKLHREGHIQGTDTRPRRWALARGVLRAIDRAADDNTLRAARGDVSTKPRTKRR